MQEWLAHLHALNWSHKVYRVLFVLELECQSRHSCHCYPTCPFKIGVRNPVGRVEVETFKVPTSSYSPSISFVRFAPHPDAIVMQFQFHSLIFLLAFKVGRSLTSLSKFLLATAGHKLGPSFLICIEPFVQLVFLHTLCCYARDDV